MKDVLDLYCKLSDQAINESKSAILFSTNTTDGVKAAVSAVYGEDHNIKMGNYLGLPMEWGRSKCQALQYLIERMQGKAHSWKSLLLSQAGRETLVKAVLQAVPVYIFSCFLLPNKTLKKMDGIVGRFWWAGDGERRSIHWLSKETLQQSKRSGGLGFKIFEDFNCSFLAKMGWRILTQPEALWVRLLKALYFPKCEFLSAKKGSSPSWLWSSILYGRLSLVKGSRKNIGNGDETWLSDPWRPDTEDFRCSLPHAIDFKVSEFIVQPDRVWDRQKLRSVFSEEVVMQIVMIPLTPQSFRDRWIWHHDKRERFSIK
ncbi:Uncharacterized mitochondrial protein AtMg00310 [Linum perenne]